MILVEDSPMIIFGIVDILKRLGIKEEDVNVYGSFHDMIEKTRDIACKLIIIDTPLKERDKLNEMLKLASGLPKKNILVICESTDLEIIVGLYKGGVSGILDKITPVEEIVYAIKRTMAGYGYLGTHIVEKFLRHVPMPGNQRPISILSPREKQVASLLAAGQNNQTIGKLLAIKPCTVSMYKSKIMVKLNLASIIELNRYLTEIAVSGPKKNR